MTKALTIVCCIASIAILSSVTIYKQQKDELAKFMTISDIHLNSFAHTAATFGCDATVPVFDLAMGKFDQLIKSEKPEFILYLGDLPVHQDACWGQLTTIPQDIGVVLAALRKKAQENNVPLLYLPGNNDGFGGDYHSFTYDSLNARIRPYNLDVKDSTLWPIIDGKNSSSASLMIDVHKEFGFYSAYPLGKSQPGKKLRLLMLNTVIFCCSPGNWTPYVVNDNISQSVALNAQINWMKQQLADAQKKKEAVIVAMHIPPAFNVYGGNSNWTTEPLYVAEDSALQTPNEVFSQLVDAYQDNIVALLTSHTHMDEIKGYFDAQKKLVELAISTPGVSMNHDNNPAMKVFQYDAKSFDLMDFTTYYARPDEMEQNGEITYGWSKWGNDHYTFSVEMGCKPGSSMMECLNQLQGGQGTLNQTTIVNKLDGFYMTKSPLSKSMKTPSALDVYIKGAIQVTSK